MATPRIPRSIGRYSVTISQADTKGYQAYLIIDPQGNEHCAGRHRGSKAECERHCAKILARINDTHVGWSPLKLPGTR